MKNKKKKVCSRTIVCALMMISVIFLPSRVCAIASSDEKEKSADETIRKRFSKVRAIHIAKEGSLIVLPEYSGGGNAAPLVVQNKNDYVTLWGAVVVGMVITVASRAQSINFDSSECALPLIGGIIFGGMYLKRFLGF